MYAFPPQIEFEFPSIAFGLAFEYSFLWSWNIVGRIMMNIVDFDGECNWTVISQHSFFFQYFMLIMTRKYQWIEIPMYQNIFQFALWHLELSYWFCNIEWISNETWIFMNLFWTRNLESQSNFIPCLHQ